MQSLLAILKLTLKAAFRFRLVTVLVVLLIGSVVILPVIIKDDGTARGFTQILLTYTLALTTALLGLATLWLACGTLARDIEECQIQMVAVKPVARWQIWLGKLLGIMTLNAILLAVAGAAIYGLMQWRAGKLPEAQQKILRDEVLVARTSAKEPMPDYEADAERVLQERLQKNPVAPHEIDLLRNQIREQVKAAYQVVLPGYRREWNLDLGRAKNSLKDQPLYLRVKFNVAQTSSSGTYVGIWEVGDPNSGRVSRLELKQAAETFHELQIPPNSFNEQGMLTVNFINQNETALLFPLEEGFEVLYRRGGFGSNFIRGLGIIFLWLSLFAAIGLAASSFLSFPVAAFVSLGLLAVGLSSGTISQVIEQGTVGAVNHETGVADKPMILDHIALPVFKGLLKVINLVQGFSPIDSLSTGRSITWGQLGLAFVQISLLLGGIFAALGIAIFSRRELATAQGTQ